MMKKAMLVAALMLTSLTLALLGGYLIGLSFKKGDCDGGCNSGQLLWAVPAIFLCCNWVGWLLWRRSRRTRGSAVGIAAILSVLTLMPTLAACAYRLWQMNQALQQQVAVRASVDYSHMLLAVRDLPSSGSLAGARCAFSAVSCEQPLPRHIEALCDRQGVVSIAESDWSSLMRLPREDFPGMPVPPEVARFPHACGRP